MDIIVQDRDRKIYISIFFRYNNVVLEKRNIMKILSINTGSSSLKFSLFEMNNEEVIASGLFERIGLDGVYTIKYQGKKIKEEVELKNHTDAVKI